MDNKTRIVEVNFPGNNGPVFYEIANDEKEHTFKMKGDNGKFELWMDDELLVPIEEPSARVSPPANTPPVSE